MHLTGVFLETSILNPAFNLICYFSGPDPKTSRMNGTRTTSGVKEWMAAFKIIVLTTLLFISEVVSAATGHRSSSFILASILIGTVSGAAILASNSQNCTLNASFVVLLGGAGVRGLGGVITYKTPEGGGRK